MFLHPTTVPFCLCTAFSAWMVALKYVPVEHVGVGQSYFRIPRMCVMGVVLLSFLLLYIVQCLCVCADDPVIAVSSPRTCGPGIISCDTYQQWLAHVCRFESTDGHLCAALPLLCIFVRRFIDFLLSLGCRCSLPEPSQTFGALLRVHGHAPLGRLPALRRSEFFLSVFQ